MKDFAEKFVAAMAMCLFLLAIAAVLSAVVLGILVGFAWLVHALPVWGQMLAGLALMVVVVSTVIALNDNSEDE